MSLIRIELFDGPDDDAPAVIECDSIPAAIAELADLLVCAEGVFVPVVPAPSRN